MDRDGDLLFIIYTRTIVPVFVVDKYGDNSPCVNNDKSLYQKFR